MSNIIELFPVHERWSITVNADAGEVFVDYIPPSIGRSAGILISAKSIESVPSLIEQGKRLLARENAVRASAKGMRSWEK